MKKGDKICKNKVEKIETFGITSRTLSPLSNLVEQKIKINHRKTRKRISRKR